MKPIKQTILDKKVGNCFASCVASVFELPLDAVPNFCAHEDWWERLQAWLAPQNLAFIELPTKDGGMPDMPTLPDGVLCLAAGMGDRGVQHAVVVKYRVDEGGKTHRLELAHDPHPSGVGLVKTEYLGWFMVIDPSKPIREETTGDNANE